jgi:hypothetical protein
VTEELTSFALLTGTVTDAVAAPPAPLRSPIGVRIVGIGTPPVPSGALWARAYSGDGFVIAAAAGSVALDDPSSTAPDPKHLAGAFDLHFILSARGYADVPVVLACNHDALPIAATYALAPLPFAIRGRVTAGTPPAPVAGALVSITAASPAIVIPPPATTAPDGTYALPSVPAARSLTLTVNAHSETVAPTYPDPVLTVNFAL